MVIFNRFFFIEVLNKFILFDSGSLKVLKVKYDLIVCIIYSRDVNMLVLRYI